MSDVQKVTPAKTPGPVINKAVKADQKKAKADQDGVGKKPDQKVAEKAAEEKKAAPKKAPKAEKVQEQYPWRPNTIMRAVFMKALEGAKEEQLQKLVESTAYDGNWAFHKKILLRGFSGINKDTKVFTWKVNREDRKIQPYDIKRVAQD